MGDQIIKHQSGVETIFVFILRSGLSMMKGGDVNQSPYCKSPRILCVRLANGPLRSELWTPQPVWMSPKFFECKGNHAPATYDDVELSRGYSIMPERAKFLAPRAPP